MTDYSGFEPQVGEIRALRTFRIGPGGVLYPVFTNGPWMPGTNTSVCRLPSFLVGDDPPHRAPAPGCSCGFYAYGTEPAAAEYPQARHVLGVVSCWGRVIAGTRGLRAERARIEALWMSASVPPELVTDVTARYPSTRIHADRREMLAQHPPTELDCYELDPPSRRGIRRLVIGLVVAIALVVGSLPATAITGTVALQVLWGVESALLIAGAFVLRKRRSDTGAKRLMLLAFALVLWLDAPFAGIAGIVLLRLPMIQIAALSFLQRWSGIRAAGRFPAHID
jgi:hypothetical protein